MRGHLADFTKTQTAAFACRQFYISSPPDEGYGQSDDVPWIEEYALFHIGGKKMRKKVVTIVTRMRGRFRLIIKKE